MTLFAVGSRNPVKLAAVRDGAGPFFSDLQVAGVDAASGVAAQPRGDAETLAGALNRARQALELAPEDAYGVGLEGGVVELGPDMFACAWCAIMQHDGQQGVASTGRCMLPRAVAELVRGGMELGQADDIVFARSQSRLNEGAVGLLTRGAIDRARFYAPAVTMALVPFLNPDHFARPGEPA